jgi:hydroxymethylpyrimidine/phosphomethylpyrimidine kinase
MMAERNRDEPVVLTIAGFDPSGGAGTIADIRTFLHFRCLPTAAITSLTFQNSQGVFGAIHESAGSVRAQILPIIEEHKIAAIKIGMLATAELISEVAALIDEKDLPAPVVDPVMQSSSGHRLIEAGAMETFVRELMPLARLITPNIPEAESLTGLRIEDEQTMHEAAQKLHEMGANAVLIKGGHLREQRSEVRDQESERGSSPTVREGGDQAVDILDDDGQVTVFRGEWIDAPPVRGTGCMLSSAIAACLAQGMQLQDAIAAAKQFVAAQIQNSKLKTQN